MITLYDAYQSVLLTSGTAPENCPLDHIDKVFEHMTMLRYAQTFYLNQANIQISALPAGHTVGGAIWKIKAGEDMIVYAPSFNHKREAHLDGAPFELISKPTLLITSAEQALQASVLRKSRDEKLLDEIYGTLKNKGNVLIPVDTACRSLELLQLLEMNWYSGRRKESLVLLSNQSKRTIDLAKGMLEWMGQSMMRAFESDRSNPFDLRQFKLCHTVAEVAAVPEPKVVLASVESMDSGFSRFLLTSWAAQSRSLILFVTPPPPGSLAHGILTDTARQPKVTLHIFENVPLEGEELKAYYRAQEEERQRAIADAAFEELRRKQQEEEEAFVDLSDEEDDHDASAETSARKAEAMAEIDKINSAKALREIYWTDYGHDWYDDPSWQIEAAAELDYPLHDPTEVLGNGRLARHQMFPFQTAIKRSNDYGVPVDPKSFGGDDQEEAEASMAEAKKEVKAKPRSEKKAKREIPTKMIDYTKELTIKCHRSFVDFSGLTDGRSLRTIISQIDPKRLILVGGPNDPTDFLLNHLLFTKAGKEGFECRAPAVNETVKIQIASNTVQAYLTENIIEQLKLSLYKDVELAFVRAVVERRTDETEAVESNNELDEVAPVIDEKISLVAPSQGLYATARKPMLVGDVKLHELRAVVTGKLGVNAEFISGDLVMSDGRVRIKKDEDGLVFEGPTSEDFFRIRDLLYSQLATV